MKDQQKCFCCLLSPTNERELIQFKINERKLYTELTGNEISKELKAKICASCREKLKSLSKFLKLCKESYNKQLNIVSIQEISSKDEILVTVCEENHDPSLANEDEDNYPISITRDQDHQDDEIVQDENRIIEILEIEKLDIIQEIQEIPDKEKNYKCKYCEKSFTTNQKLQSHSFSHSGVGERKCDFKGCEKEFATEARLNAHLRIHMNEKFYLCDVCNTSFEQSNALKSHKKIHTKKRSYVCPYENCGKSFSQNTVLKTHIAAKHDKDSCIQCDVAGCTKKFPRNSFLILHKKRDHENIRNYSCTKCERTYKQQSHLTRHIESTHMNIRHMCTLCNKTFSKSWSLKMHQFKHTDANNFPYKCTECEMSFQRRDKWLKHYSKLHPNTEIKRDPIEINFPVK